MDINTEHHYIRALNAYMGSGSSPYITISWSWEAWLPPSPLSFLQIYLCLEDTSLSLSLPYRIMYSLTLIVPVYLAPSVGGFPCPTQSLLREES